MNAKVWYCKIGFADPDDVPGGGDAPMRAAVERAFRQHIGSDPEFTFSGWGAELEEEELAVVENRLPDLDKQIEVARERLDFLLHAAGVSGYSSS